MPGLAEHRYHQRRRTPVKPQPVFAEGDLVQVRDTADIRARAAQFPGTRMTPGTVGMVERVFEAHPVMGSGGTWTQPSYRVIWEGPGGTTWTNTVPKARLKLAR